MVSMTSARLLGAGRSRYRLGVWRTAVIQGYFSSVCTAVMKASSRRSVDWALAVRPASTDGCGCMHGFSKVIVLSPFFQSRAYSRCTNRAAAEHPQLRVDSAPPRLLAHGFEPSAANPVRAA